MKLALGVASLVLSSSFGMHAQDIAGTWTGTLHANRDLRLELHIEAKGESEWTGSLLSLDQTAKPVPVDTVWVKGNRIVLTARQIGSSFEGTIDPGDKALTGYWLQGIALPLTFTKKQ